MAADLVARAKQRQMLRRDRALVRAAQAADQPLVADMTDWGLGEPRKFVTWRVG